MSVTFSQLVNQSLESQLVFMVITQKMMQGAVSPLSMSVFAAWEKLVP